MKHPESSMAMTGVKVRSIVFLIMCGRSPNDYQFYGLPSNAFDGVEIAVLRAHTAGVAVFGETHLVGL